MPCSHRTVGRGYWQFCPPSTDNLQTILFFRLFQSLKRQSISSFIWEIVKSEDETMILPEQLKLKVSLNYGKEGGEFQDSPFQGIFDFENFKVSFVIHLHVLRSEETAFEIFEYVSSKSFGFFMHY